MNAIELLDIISTGETSKVQFKEKMPHPDSIAGEMIAMSNSMGGTILFGVKDKTGDIVGLTYEEIQQYSTSISNVATGNIIPSIYITTEVVSIDKNGGKKVLVVSVDEGINKPYKDKNGYVFVKQGPDKRRVTDNAEMIRLYQGGSHLLADEIEVFNTSTNDIDEDKFRDFFQKEFGRSIREKGLSFEQALKAKKVLRNNKLTLAGLLFFGKAPQSFKPAFCIKAVSFFGNKISGKDYRSKPNDLSGTVPDLFKKGMDFFLNNLRHSQQGQNFNRPGILEISRVALEELLINALVHRDYFKNAPIRLIIFDNRIEMISPGKLPNNLTVEDIKYGNPVIRNNQLVAFGQQTMPFSGLGSGIRRSLDEQPNIEFTNDVDGEQFVVIIPRPGDDE